MDDLSTARFIHTRSSIDGIPVHIQTVYEKYRANDYDDRFTDHVSRATKIARTRYFNTVCRLCEQEKLNPQIILARLNQYYN